MKYTASNACGSTTVKDVVIIGTKPTAGFRTQSPIGCVPFTVQYEITSTTSATDFIWTFPGGNPSSSTDRNPIVTYNAKGKYDAKLVAKNFLESDSLTLTDFIEVKVAPTAEFQNSITGFVSYFTNLSTEATNYYWDFGDNKTSTEANPSHNYGVEGEFNVRLITEKGTGTATWRGATFRWYPGTDLTAAFDSASLTSTEVGQSWGQSTIANGRALTSGWIFSATVPFTVTVEYRYRFDGGTDQASERAQFRCQPALPDNPSSPTITNLSLQPASGIIEPGDTLTIAYSATAEAGLWQSLVVVTGGCDTAHYIPGQLAATATTTISFTLSRSCGLGQSISVAVFLLDAALQQTSSGVASALTVQDLTPPVLDIAFGLGGLDRVAAGDYFVGDTLTFTPYVSENHRLRTILWEVQPAGVTDSATPLPSSVSIPVLRLPIRSEWGTAVQLAFRARDEAGNTSPGSEVSNSPSSVCP